MEKISDSIILKWLLTISQNDIDKLGDRLDIDSRLIQRFLDGVILWLTEGRN